MSSNSFIVFALLLFVGCSNPRGDLELDRKVLAESFFRGVWGCNPSVVDDLAADGVIVSYPIFESLYGTPAIRGREAVKELASGFCQMWADPKITVHEAISEGDRVVLLWSFRGRNVAARENGQPPTNLEHSWGGITIIRFDNTGKITAEIGEESEPGPIQRLVLPQAGG